MCYLNRTYHVLLTPVRQAIAAAFTASRAGGTTIRGETHNVHYVKDTEQFAKSSASRHDRVPLMAARFAPRLPIGFGSGSAGLGKGNSAMKPRDILVALAVMFGPCVGYAAEDACNSLDTRPRWRAYVARGFGHRSHSLASSLSDSRRKWTVRARSCCASTQ